MQEETPNFETIIEILVRHQVEMIQLKNDITFKILQLETLIDVKEKTARKKDIVMLDILKAMRENGQP